MKAEHLDGPKTFVIHEFLTAEECVRFIALSEKAGYVDAPITTAAGFLMRKDVRDNDRVMIDDPALAASLWERAKPLVPADWLGWKAVGLNERFRYDRYGEGQHFAPHYDGCFARQRRAQPLQLYRIP